MIPLALLAPLATAQPAARKAWPKPRKAPPSPPTPNIPAFQQLAPLKAPDLSIAKREGKADDPDRIVLTLDYRATLSFEGVVAGSWRTDRTNDITVRVVSTRGSEWDIDTQLETDLTGRSHAFPTKKGDAAIKRRPIEMLNTPPLTETDWSATISRDDLQRLAQQPKLVAKIGDLTFELWADEIELLREFFWWT